MRKRLPLIAVLSACILCGNASAGPCDAYFPFDGNLADAGGNGYHGLAITRDGQPGALQFAEGKIGQALHVTGENAMRAFIDLHYDFCPQVTVTAWFRLASNDADGNQYIFSTGAGAGPGMYAIKTSMMMNGTGNPIYQRDAIRDPNTWFFLAGVYDYTAGTFDLYWRNRVVNGKFSDSRRDPEDSFWVGTYNDSMSYTAQDLYVDDLRIHGRALTPDEIRSLASDAPSATSPAVNSGATAALPACETHEQCAAGTYCAWDNTCHPERHAPMQMLQFGTVEVSPGTPILSEDARTGEGMTLTEMQSMFAERNANRVAGITYESPDDLLRQAASSTETGTGASGGDSGTAERKVVGWRVSPSDVKMTPTSGYAGDIVVPTEVAGTVMTGIDIFEPNNVPCDIDLIGDGTAASGANIDRCTPSIWLQVDASIWNTAVITPAPVTSLQVCDSWQENQRVKGILVSGNDIGPDGTPGFYRQAKADGPNCEDWLGIVACDTGYVSTGVVAHFKDRDLSDSLVGLQLICRKIDKIYE